MCELKVAYVINLDRRPDRWIEFTEKSSSLNIPIERFSAVDGQNLPKSELRSPAPISACWMSHQAVAKKFLESNAKYCLILEDDLALNQESITSLNKIWEKDFQHIDLLQIGFCIHGNRLSNRVVHNVQMSLVRILSLFNLLKFSLVKRLLKSIYGYEFEFLRQIGAPVAVRTFELGTHAYFISRNFADAMITFNNPVYLPADIAMMELAKITSTNSFRLIDSLINQSTSITSINNMAWNPLEELINQNLEKEL